MSISQSIFTTLAAMSAPALRSYAARHHHAGHPTVVAYVAAEFRRRRLVSAQS